MQVPPLRIPLEKLQQEYKDWFGEEPSKKEKSNLEAFANINVLSSRIKRTLLMRGLYSNHRVLLSDRRFLHCSPICYEDEVLYASEAPTKETLVDFVKFVNEPLPENPLGIQAIVCLITPTRTSEGMMNYWGSKTVFSSVLYYSPQKQEALVLRHVRLDKKMIIHIQAVKWRDYGACSVVLLRTLIDELLKIKGSILFHCLAGEGRTGVAIAAYRAIKSKSYDMDREILWMRMQRPSMIHTLEQYELLINLMKDLQESSKEKRICLPSP
jgi:protein tyrosine phosphatase